MKNKYLFSILITILLLQGISAMNVDYFYSKNCPHCNNIKPLIIDFSYSYPQHNWNFFDVSRGSYNVSGVPTIKIKTSDCRRIDLVGIYEIPKYLRCELQEMSTRECPTHLTLNRGSFFIE
jgi:thiol-disulfide isomerase/thioredoxin